VNSCLYTGILAHRRLRPRRHAFRYPATLFHVDLDELPALDRSLRLLGVNRSRLFTFRDRDHLDGRDGELKPRLLAFLAARGLDLAGGKVFLLTQCRLFGYVFNPISLYYCHGLDAQLRAVVAEVDNTFGERILYVLKPEGPAGAAESFRASARKEMHVSPFVSMDARYHFWLRAPGERLTVAIAEEERGEHFFDAHLWGRRRPLRDAALLAIALRHPLLTWNVTAAIHWQALRLWWKGVPVHHQPPPSPAQRAQRELLHRLAEGTAP
jgi:DUF1365 family protein